MCAISCKMTKRGSLIFIILSMLFVQIRTYSVVKNVTVPSDILTKLLFNEVQDLTGISVQNVGIYNSEKCILSLLEIVKRLPSLEVFPFIDAWGKLPSGLLYGHFQDLGNFDQCTRISTTLSLATGVVNGQYCSATIPLLQNDDFVQPVRSDMKINDWPVDTKIRIGICTPDVCDPELLQAVFQKATKNVFNGALSGIKLNNCITAKEPDFQAIDIFGIVIFSVFGALILLSTAYDVYTKCFEKPTLPLLLAFSVLKNGRKLFAIGTTKSPNSIDCITGIRIFSMIWVVYYHLHSMYKFSSILNRTDLLKWHSSALSMPIREATIAVDTFFLIGGLLVAWSHLRELDKSQGNLNIRMMYFHRYLRLTPPLAALIVFELSIAKFIGFGPYRQFYIWYHALCETSWWSTMLYIQNYVHPNQMCIVQSWYLAVDTQLYFLSPLILIPLWKWGRKFVPVMVILSVLSMASVIWMFFMDSINYNYVALVYQPTHARCTAWLIGVGLGYFMHKNKNKSMVPSKLLQLLGWTVCFVIIFSVVYGRHFLTNGEHSTPDIASGLFEAVKRPLWAMAIGWLVFACHFEFGGIINSFLSHPWWQPLGRLTYSMYLVHTIVLGINFEIIRTDIYFSVYAEILLLWSTLGITLMLAIVWNFAFELPVFVIEKSVLGEGTKSK